jgi:hypothetical protein
MAVSRTLRRLLRVLNLQEEQSKLALESGIAGLRRLEQAVEATSDQARAGRCLVHASAQTGELPDRLAGLEETRAANRRALALASRIAAAQSEVASLRQEFLAKRIECRQAETLIHQAETRDAIESGRRTQQGLDSWYLNRLSSARIASSTNSEPPAYPSTDSSPSGEAPRAASRQNLSENLIESASDVLNREKRSRF